MCEFSPFFFAFPLQIWYVDAKERECCVSASDKIAFEFEMRLRRTEDENQIEHMLNSNNKSI